jgi:hypothetical protein
MLDSPSVAAWRQPGDELADGCLAIADYGGALPERGRDHFAIDHDHAQIVAWRVGFDQNVGTLGAGGGNRGLQRTLRPDPDSSSRSSW